MKNINLCCFLLILLSTPYTLASAASTKSGIDQSFIDTSVRPQDDFFRYVNGKWLKEFVIPADKSNYGSFTKLIDESEKHIHTIIRDAQQAKAEMGSDKQRIGDLFQSFMDNKTIEKKGITPLKNEFARIDAIQDLKTLSAYIAHAQILTTAPFNIYVQVDEKNPNQYITYLYQAGLGLPDREYYLQQDQKSLDIKEAYLTHIEKMLTLAGVTHVKTASARIFAIESALAKIQWSKEQRRDSIKTYNLTSTKALQKQLSNLDWETWVNASGLNNIKHIVVSVPSYVIALNGLFQSIGIDDWKIYFRWKLISTAAPYLSSAFVKENFAFYQTILAGVPENQPRWKRGVLLVNYTFGELVGKIYVEKHFSEDAKKYMQDMVENLRQAYQKSMHELTWMTPKTKNKALQKLAKFTPKIGYPDKFRDYAGLAITKDDLYGNIVAISQYESKYNLDKLGKKVDRAEWHMKPQTVNAYYNPTMNEIVFPAGILQPPFFTKDGDDAVNYGAIGAVIGHEMGHGFDDQGSRYDGDGLLKNWWTQQDRKAFEISTKKLIDQYNGFKVFDDLHVNGTFTQGENIGDLSGLAIAYKAYQLSKKGKEAPMMDGLTGDQRFFFGWAQIWRRKYREQELRRRINTDPHAPEEFRVNGILQNMPEFYQAFDVKKTDQMFLPAEQRVKIW